MTEVSNPHGNSPGEALPKKSRLFLVFFLVVIVLVVAGAIMMFQRHGEYQALASNTEALAVPTVAVIHPIGEPGDENLVLPGSLQAYVESPIYAPTCCDLKAWGRDIGSRLGKGT